MTAGVPEFEHAWLGGRCVAVARNVPYGSMISYYEDECTVEQSVDHDRITDDGQLAYVVALPDGSVPTPPETGDEVRDGDTLEIDGHDGRVTMRVGSTRLDFSPQTAWVVGDALVSAADQALKITTEATS